MLIRLLVVGGIVVITGGASLVRANASEASQSYHVIEKTPLGGEGFWDYLTVDSASRRLYFGRSDRIVVFNLDTNKVVGEISGMAGVHGVAVVPEVNRGFITSGKDDTVRIFDLKSLKETGKVKAGSNPDAILYDRHSKTIFAFNHSGKSVTTIDASTGNAKTTIEIGGEPEAAVSDGKGKVYVNLEDTSEVAVIDAKKLSVISRWSLAPGDEPTGLALDVKHGRLFSACHNKLMMVLDSATGKVVAKLPIGSRVDGAEFDPESQNAFSSNGDGTVTVIHENNPDSFSVAQTIQTQEGSRTMTIDPKTHRIWLAAATFTEATSSTQHQNRQHKAMVPGSFSLLVVGK